MRRIAMTLALAAMLAAGPTLGLADDQQIAQAVVQNLKKHQASGEMKGFDIDLNVEDGKVTLTGNVADARQHQLAIDAARFAPGVKVVVNDLKIKGTQAQHPEQEKSLGANLASLFRRPAANAAQAPAQTSQQPTVPTPNSDDVANQQIAQAIAQNLQKHQAAGELKGFDIDMSVEDGKVTLTGNVADARQHRLAIDAARYAPGVKVVVNELKIQGVQAQHPEQQKTLGANLASLFRRADGSRPVQAPSQSEQQPQAPAQTESNAAPQKPAGILAGLRRSWNQPEEEVASADVKPQQQPQPGQLVEKPAVPLFNLPGNTQQQAHAAADQHQLPVEQMPVAPMPVAQVPQADPESMPVANQFARPEAPALPGDFDAVPDEQKAIVAAEPAGPTRLLPMQNPVASEEQVSQFSSQPAESQLQRPEMESSPSDDLASQPQVPSEARDELQAQPQMASPMRAPVQAQPVLAQASQFSEKPVEPTAARPVRPVVRVIPIPAGMMPAAAAPRSQAPRAFAASGLPGSPEYPPQPQGVHPAMMMGGPNGAPIQLVQASQPQGVQPAPQFIQGTGGGVIPARYDHPQMPGYAWPSYASYPNYAALQYPKQYSAHAWPYIGPFYPYPQVPLGWRKVTLNWDDGWWMLDFKDKGYGPYVTR